MTTASTSYERQSSSKNPPVARTTTGEMQPVDDVLEYVKTYAIHNPGTAAAWCFGIGFIVGWKLKPW